MGSPPCKASAPPLFDLPQPFVGGYPDPTVLPKKSFFILIFEEGQEKCK